MSAKDIKKFMKIIEGVEEQSKKVLKESKHFPPKVVYLTDEYGKDCFEISISPKDTNILKSNKVEIEKFAEEFLGIIDDKVLDYIEPTINGFTDTWGIRFYITEEFKENITAIDKDTIITSILRTFHNILSSITIQ